MSKSEEDYERYLERYCKCNRISREEAEKHQLVRDVKKYYEEDAYGRQHEVG